jgi:GNAT superfamily N-acetyltransferase
MKYPGGIRQVQRERGRDSSSHWTEFVLNTRLVPALRRTKDREAVNCLRRHGLAERAVVHHLAAGHVYDFHGGAALVVRDAPMGVSTTTVLRVPASLDGPADWSDFIAALAAALPAERLVVRAAPGSDVPGLRPSQHWVVKAPAAAVRASGIGSVRRARDAADLEFAEDLRWRSFITAEVEPGRLGLYDPVLQEVLIAEVDGHRAGHLTWEIKADELSRQPYAVVHDLAVLPEYAGHGIGAALAAELESRQVMERAPLSLAGGLIGREADRILGRLGNDGWTHRFSTWGIGRWAAR